MFNDNYICVRLVNTVMSPVTDSTSPARVGGLCRHKPSIRVDELVVGRGRFTGCEDVITCYAVKQSPLPRRGRRVSPPGRLSAAGVTQ